MKKIASILLIALLAMAMVWAGGDKDESAGTASSSSGAYKALLLVNGNLGDKGFFDSAASGFYTLRDEYGVEAKIVEMGRNEASYESYYLDASEQDWDVIASGTFSVKELAEDTAKEFPEKNYIFFDGTSSVENLMGISYKSNETGFMAGALAALMLNEADDAKIDSSKKVLGFIGSMDSAGINDFLLGYIDGICYVDPTIRVLTTYVGSFEDVPKCLEMTTQLYNQGAQIVYAPTSQSLLGAVTASSNVDKYLIGCDTDIYEAMVGTDANVVRNVISTSVKKVGESLVIAINGLRDGSMKTSENYVMGLVNGSVGLAKNDNYYKLVPQAVQDRLDQIEQDVIDGIAVAREAVGRPTEEVAAIRDSMKP